MKLLLQILVAAGIVIAAFLRADDVPARLDWDVDVQAPAEFEIGLTQGESVTLAPRYLKNEQAVSITNTAAVTFYFREHGGTGTAYYVSGGVGADDGTVEITLPSTLGLSVTQYVYWVSIVTNATANLRARGIMTVLQGYGTATAPPPYVSIMTGGTVTNIADARIAVHNSATNAHGGILGAAVTNVVVNGVTGTVAGRVVSVTIPVGGDQAITNDAPADGGQYVRKDLNWAALLEYDPNWAGVSGVVMQTVTDWNGASGTVYAGAALGATALQPNAVDGTDPLGNVFANGQLTTLGAGTPWTGMGYYIGDGSAFEPAGTLSTWLAGVPNISTFNNDSAFITAGDVPAAETDGLSFHTDITEMLLFGATTFGTSAFAAGSGASANDYGFAFGPSAYAGGYGFAFGDESTAGGGGFSFGTHITHAGEPEGIFNFSEAAFSGMGNNSFSVVAPSGIYFWGPLLADIQACSNFPVVFPLFGGGEFDTAVVVSNTGTLLHFNATTLETTALVTNNGSILLWNGGEIDSATIVTNGGTANLSGLTFVDEFQPTMGLANATNFPLLLTVKDGDGVMQTKTTMLLCETNASFYYDGTRWHIKPPDSTTGLEAGDMWNNAGTLEIYAP